jgi:hypothetical protein
MREHPLHMSSVFANSTDAMAAILSLHFPKGRIVDVNYGLGTFYRKCEDRDITGVDIRPTGDIQCDNRHLPFCDDEYEVGVCDPPFKRGDGVKYETRYGVAPKTETQVTWSYYETISELLRISSRGVVIKMQDGTDGHRFHSRLFHIAAWMKSTTTLDPHDICHISRKRLVNTMVNGEPHFFKQGVSYFLIYRWRQKAPYKPSRF